MRGQLRLSGGRKLQSPTGLSTRPTTARVREAVMNLLGSKIQGSNWLELCSGSGIMSCEALLRGAKRILAVDRNNKTAQICKSNLISTASGISPLVSIQVECQEVVSFLKRGCQPQSMKSYSEPKQRQFELVYFDPPYGSGLYKSIMDPLLKGKWVKKDSLVICEHDSKITLDTPPEWIIEDKRCYGSSGLLILSPPRNYHDDTDSMHLQRDQAT